MYFTAYDITDAPIFGGRETIGHVRYMFVQNGREVDSILLPRNRDEEANQWFREKYFIRCEQPYTMRVYDQGDT